MHQVRCENKRFDNSNNLIKCNRLLAILPDSVIEALYLNEGEKIITTCHSCKKDRFAEISVNNGKIGFKAITSIDVSNNEQIVFDNVINIEDVRMGE